MKTSRSNNNMQSSSGNTKKPKPEIRDDMDSHKTKKGRVRKEQMKKSHALPGHAIREREENE